MTSSFPGRKAPRVLASIVSFCFFTGAYLQGQEIDTLRIIRLLELEHQLDSLRLELRTVDRDLQSVKVRVSEGVDLNELLSALSGEEVDAPEDQRSKRKRVDALLKAITARPGQLRFNGGATTIFQGNPATSGGFTTATGSVNIFAHTSLGPASLLFFDFEAIGGNGPNHHVPTLTPVNADAGSTQDNEGFDHLIVNEAWVEFSVWKNDVTATAGKIDLTNYFDNNSLANDETSQFISAAFVNSAALPAPGSTIGMRIRWSVLSRLYLQAGLSSIHNAGNDLFTDLMKIGSVGFELFPESRHEANVRIYGYAHPSAGDGTGYGISYDQNVIPAISVFSRWNRNEPKLAGWYPVREAWSAGTRWVTSLSGQKCVVSAAYGHTYASSTQLATEQTFETYMRYHLNTWTLMSLHLQHIRNAAGQRGGLSLVGLRCQFNF